MILPLSPFVTPTRGWAMRTVRGGGTAPLPKAGRGGPESPLTSVAPPQGDSGPAVGEPLPRRLELGEARGRWWLVDGAAGVVGSARADVDPRPRVGVLPAALPGDLRPALRRGLSDLRRFRLLRRLGLRDRFRHRLVLVGGRLALRAAEPEDR